MNESDGTSGFIPPAIEELNQWLSGYEITDLLACGGMGAVYRARQISLDRLVAIKILPPELAVDEAFRKSFEAEGKAMAKLSHSNLVGVFDFGEISNMLYLVIEFVEGSTLYESKGDSAIDAEVAVTLVRSVSAGLAEAHRIGLVHRDIKPANILINMDLVPKLGDFGLAVPDSDIESGLMMGTPAYLAPEVMEDPSSASFASDTYALGVILYEMLTGSSIEQGDVMDLTRVPMLGDLQKIVRQAVDPKPLLRYQNGGELENALKEWMRKPKNSGLRMNAGGGAASPKIAPVVITESGGGGGLLLGLVALLIVGGLAWATFGRGSESADSSDKTTSNPSTVIPTDPLQSKKGTEAEKLQALDELRTGQRNALLELSTRIAEERNQNRREFLEAAGDEGKALLNLVPEKSEDLPRYFLPGEVEISAELLEHLQNFAGSRQMETDRQFLREISSLHRTSMRELREFKTEVPPDLTSDWERWVGWLGQNSMEVMHTSIAGLWRLSPASEGFELHLSATGKKLLILGEERIERDDLIGMDESGEISLQYSDNTGFRFPWKLRWLGDCLEGKDARGDQRLLRPEDFDYEDHLKVPQKTKIPPLEMAETLPDDDSPKVRMFQDPEVAALTENYRSALGSKIEPLESGYVRVLESARDSYRSRSEEAAVEQIEEELEWLGSLNWREGFTHLETLPSPGELPSDVVDKQELFRREFVKRYEPVQRTYRSSLQRMLRIRKSKRSEDLGDIEKAIEMLEIPEGTVRARYIKIEALPDDGIKHATIAMIDIIDAKGVNLPIKNFSNVEVSSFEENDEGRKASGDRALDGDPKTFWHSAWNGTRAEFPHWISFDLGDEQWITGFRITPRKLKFSRSTDVTNWRFHISLDGKEWTTVAKGNFPKGNQPNEHLGFKAIP